MHLSRCRIEPMQKLRSIHLYLGCIFAPLLLFFAISGIWQTLGFHSHFLDLLSTIHMSRGMKIGRGFASAAMMIFVLLMALSFIVSTILGVMMALKFGRSKRAACYCLAAGVLVPLVIIMVTSLIR
jgi:hypothetical protein